MNSSMTNTGGWEACNLRGTLNNTTINSLENKNYIKQVNKQYIKTYNNAGSVTTSQDKLWLLSFSEVWNGGIGGRVVAKEGEQYKYYENIKGDYFLDDFRLIKKNNGSNFDWWHRSPYNGETSKFMGVNIKGSNFVDKANITSGVAPGFCI